MTPTTVPTLNLAHLTRLEQLTIADISFTALPGLECAPLRHLALYRLPLSEPLEFERQVLCLRTTLTHLDVNHAMAYCVEPLLEALISMTATAQLSSIVIRENLDGDFLHRYPSKMERYLPLIQRLPSLVEFKHPYTHSNEAKLRWILAEHRDLLPTARRALCAMTTAFHSWRVCPYVLVR